MGDFELFHPVDVREDRPRSYVVQWVVERHEATSIRLDGTGATAARNDEESGGRDSKAGQERHFNRTKTRMNLPLFISLPLKVRALTPHV